MKKTRYVISYDISNDKRRRKVVKALEGAGFRVQYSVFECDLSDTQYKRLKARLKPFVKPQTQDNIKFYPLCVDCAAKVESFGADRMQTLGGLLIV